MDKILSDQDIISKQTNDGRVQIKQLTIFKDLLNYLETLDKKALTQIQSKIEDLLLNLILSNRITSDILSRYISHIYIYIFDKGRNSHLTDFINYFCSILEPKDKEKHVELSDNIKCTFLWIIGYICKKCEYKSPSMGLLMDTLFDVCSNKVTSILFLDESMRLISKFLNLKIMNMFGNRIVEYYKFISKKEKEISNKKYVIKSLYGSLFYYQHKELAENNFFHKKYNYILDFLENYFRKNDDEINKIAINTFIYLHDNIIFQPESIKEVFNIKDEDKKNKDDNSIFSKNSELLNFIQVIKYFSEIDSIKYIGSLNDGGKRILSHIKIIIYYIEKNKNFINVNEEIIDQLYEILLNSYNVHFGLTSLTVIDGLNIVNNTNYLSMKNSEHEEEINNSRSIEDKINQKISLLFRIFIKTIYITSHRMHFLTGLFSKLKEVQTYIDKLTEDSTITINDLSVLIENGIINKVYSISQINILLLSLVEISDNNPELFELNYNSFQDISNNISFFLTSGIRSFRILVTKFVCGLSYYLPNYRLSIIALILNLVGVLHSEVVQLKNNMLYFNNVRSQEYKNSLIIHKNLILFKDICNCLSMVLCTTKHKSKGIPIDSMKDSLKRVKRIILGNQIAASDINYSIPPSSLCLSLAEESEDFLSKELNAYKESGWIIAQGLCSISKNYILEEYQSIFYLLKYTFNEKNCDINEDHLSKVEYQDNLITQFFIKKEALYCLNKFIKITKNQENLELFKKDLMFLFPHIINFFIPHEKNDLLSFYQYHLKETFLDVKKNIYEIFYNLPAEYYAEHFNLLLYPLSNEIISNNYFSKDYFKSLLDALNISDTFMCVEDLSINNNDYQNQYWIDNFYIPQMLKKDNIDTDLYKNYFYSKGINFIYTSICLLNKILTNEKLNVKNKKAIIKYFLNCFTEIALKGINFQSIHENKKDYNENIGNYNKLLNISICMYFLLKYSLNKNINFVSDLEVFTNIKMIFDLSFKIEDFGILSVISSEGITNLIKTYDQKGEIMKHYLENCEIRFNTEKKIPTMNDYISSFYLLSNIFRSVDFSYIKPSIDKYMNFIISFFNPNDEIVSNPYVGQSLFSLCETLIREKEFDRVKAIIQIFEMNVIYINNSNKTFVNKKFAFESINELKLLIIFIRKYEELTNNEKALIKYILFKFVNDQLYKKTKIMRHFMLLIIEIINHKIIDELSDCFLNIDLLNFLFEKKIKYTDNLLSLYIVDYFLKNQYKLIQKITFDSTKGKDKENYIENKISYLISIVNELYHTNKNYFYLHKIYNNFIDNTNNNYFINYNNIFVKMFKNYNLIKLYKQIIQNYILINYNNIEGLINFLKNILQQKINLYKNNYDAKKEEEDNNEGGGESRLKEDQDLANISKNKPIIQITNLKYILHIDLQKFLIKQVVESVNKYVDEIISVNISNNKKNIIDKSRIDILNKLMNVCLILVQCEESWEIKYLGINLLEKLIIKFRSIKDIRSDDDSLLIQQFEVQISSCIKNIFISKGKSQANIKSLSKGFNLIYLFMTISISNDIEYVQKFNEYISILDLIDDKKKNYQFSNSINGYSEKENITINSKHFLLLCKLFISTFTNKDFGIKYLQLNNENNNNKCKKERLINIYSTNMAEDIKNYLKKIFEQKIINFCNKLKNHMLLMYQSLINQAKNNNHIHNLLYGKKLGLKYASLFLTAISILFHNPKLKGYENIFDSKFNQFICELIFYLIKQIKIQQKNNNDDSIYYCIDIFSSLIKNKIFCLNYENYLLCINEFNNIILFKEYKENNKMLLLIQNFNDILLNSENSFSQEENLSLIYKQSELIKALKSNYSNSFDQTFISIYTILLLKIIKSFDENDNKDNKLYEDCNYYIKNLYDFYINNNNVSKLVLEKIFTILLSIDKEKKLLFELIIKEFNSCLIKLTSNIQKYFTLFYILIQFISKSTNEQFIGEIKSSYIREVNKQENNLFDTANKSMLLAITQINNNNLISFLNEYINNVFCVENKNLFKNFGQESQKLVILYIQKESNDKLRKETIKNLSKFLNNSNDLLSPKEICTFILGLFNINQADKTLLNDEEIKNTFNDDVKKIINELLQASNKNKEENKENKNEEENNKDKKKDEEEPDDDFDEVDG